MGYPKAVQKLAHEEAMPKFELKVRLPRDVKDWLVEQAAENASSQTSEIVRAVRERMVRQQSEANHRFAAPSNPNDKPTSGRDF